MYNYLFGMPNRRNYPYHSGFNKNPLPIPPKNSNNRPYVKKNNESYHKGPAVNGISVKSSALGGILIPDGTDKGATYNIVSINLDTSANRNFSIQFNFTCNIATILARMNLRFQLFKQEKYTTALIPVSSSFIYTRNNPNMLSSETNTFSLFAYDCHPMKCKCCDFSIFVEIMSPGTMGNIMITNPVLMASIIENNNCAEKGENHDISH